MYNELNYTKLWWKGVDRFQLAQDGKW